MHQTLSERRILIVDDALENVELLGEILKNYKRSVALNGVDALRIVSESIKPDLILLDVMMPEMDGFEVCRQLKQQEHTKDIPIIFITSKSEVEDETRGLELGAVDFIPKPISPAAVLARVKNHLELKIAREVLEYKNQELAERNKYITDSINYAKRIQNAIFPTEDQLYKFIPESFCLNYPKDIVSGDFYWFTEVDRLKIIVVGDCTGHGVSGAFMSIIGNTLLNEIVNMMKITDPGEILNRLDSRLINELQKDFNIQAYDGIDIAIITYDQENNLMYFSGAYRPVIYMANDKLNEIRGTKKSIGDVKKELSFTTHVIKVDSEIEVYMFSDGYPDQNNNENKKIGMKRVKQIITDIHHNKMTEQKNAFAYELEKHKGREIQRDDVLMLGFRALPVEKKVIIHHQGVLDYEKILTIGEKLKSDLEKIATSKQNKLIFFCANEFLQNIINYSEDIISSEGNLFHVGEMKITFSNGAINIETQNLTSLKMFNTVKNKVDYFNSLTQDELKQMKKQIIKEETDSSSKGGGIGLLEIIRRTNSKITVSNSSIRNDKCIIHFFMKINLGELNG